MHQSLRHQFQITVVAIGTLIVPAWPHLCLAQTSQSASNPSAGPTGEAMDLDFGGGTALDYVNAIREASRGKPNIVTMPHVEEISVPPVRLRGVDVFSALSVLGGESYEDGSRQVRLSVQPVGTMGANGTGLIKISAAVKEIGPPPERTKIWSVADLISGGMTADNITTAVSAALELLQPDAPTPQVRFHKETSLLLARARVEQIGIIEDVIDQLRQSNAQKRAQTMEPVRQEANEAQARLSEAQMRLDAMNAEMTNRIREAEMAKARAEALERSSRELEAKTSAMRDDLMKRDQLISGLQIQLAEVKAALQKAKSGG